MKGGGGEGGRKSECPENTPNDEIQKMPLIKAQKFKPQPRLEPALHHWWQARRADVRANHYTARSVMDTVQGTSGPESCKCLLRFGATGKGGSLLLICLCMGEGGGEYFFNI